MCVEYAEWSVVSVEYVECADYVGCVECVGYVEC